jgi:hypothetical protein
MRMIHHPLHLLVRASGPPIHARISNDLSIRLNDLASTILDIVTPAWVCRVGLKLVLMGVSSEETLVILMTVGTSVAVIRTGRC